MIEMTEKQHVIKRIESLPEEKLGEIADFIDFLEKKRKKKPQKKKEDLLSSVIGICEGPSDLSESHDTYVYG
ncbi:MAG: DUF2281 domain-containing protein [Euryarchaeota archaeon]|nr:DUF2281 domain-containing protein [Euryarchaeota archaeon]